MLCIITCYASFYASCYVSYYASCCASCYESYYVLYYAMHPVMYHIMHLIHHVMHNCMYYVMYHATHNLSSCYGYWQAPCYASHIVCIALYILYLYSRPAGWLCSRAHRGSLRSLLMQLTQGLPLLTSYDMHSQGIALFSLYLIFKKIIKITIS